LADVFHIFENGPILLARFGDLLKLALPNTHARGRLMMEEYRIARNGIYDGRHVLRVDPYGIF
jgi:hypothetical protein